MLYSYYLLCVDPQRLQLAEASSCTLCLPVRGEERQENLAHAAVRDGNAQQQSQRGNQVRLRHHVGFALQTGWDKKLSVFMSTEGCSHILFQDPIFSKSKSQIIQKIQSVS